MSHINVELHEKYAHEHIAEWEYEFVHEQMKSIGFFQNAVTSGIDEYLPRACYFGVAGTRSEVERAWSNIKARLDRHVSVEFTAGPSYGFGLKPVLAPIPGPSVWALAALGSLPKMAKIPETNIYGSLLGHVGNYK